MQRRLLALAILLLAPLPALAKDSALGTFTVRGKTTQLNQVYAEKQHEEGDASDEYLVVLLADRAVAPADRQPARLLALTRDGKLKALRVVMHLGYDDVRVAPYDAGLNENGLGIKGLSILDLEALNDAEVEAKVSSKPLGQEWHFNVQFKAALAAGGTVELEKVQQGALPSGWTPEKAGGKETSPLAQLKYQIGQHGYPYTAEGLMQAVWDADVEAVDLFLQAGMSPDTVGSNGIAPLMYTAMYCTNDPAEKRVELALKLIAAKAKVDIKDDNGSTPLLWAAQSCPLPLVKALIDAGANVNVKAKGGGTPLMMADVMQRKDVVDLLKKAGAKPWKE